MLHKRKVARATWYAMRRRVRILLGLKPRPQPWPPGGIDYTVAHHADLLRFLLTHVPKDWDFPGKTACEVGCSHCLSIASYLLGAGCKRVDLVEPSPPALNPLQTTILSRVRDMGFDLDLTMLKETPHGLDFNPDKVIYYETAMEGARQSAAYDYILSFHTLEHVEDLPGFYRACAKALNPEGQMFHRIDFSGHSDFEDPVPPLDFQTYPDRLYTLMYPPYYRNTRSFLGDHEKAAREAGLTIRARNVTWRADPDYLGRIWPRLRREARERSPEEVGILDVVLVCQRPAAPLASASPEERKPNR